MPDPLEDRIAGVAKQLKGSSKAAVGRLIGDAKLETDGKNEQAAGRLQNLTGSIRDGLKP